MIIESASPTLMLSPGELVRLPAGACATILCASGAIWVTQDGDPRDTVLSGGQSAPLSERAATLIQAFEAATVHLRLRSEGCAGTAATRRRRVAGAWRPVAGALLARAA